MAAESIPQTHGAQDTRMLDSRQLSTLFGVAHGLCDPSSSDTGSYGVFLTSRYDFHGSSWTRGFEDVRNPLFFICNVLVNDMQACANNVYPALR